eukprot:1147564-Pelagomonas_calceolata.AAC.3
MARLFDANTRPGAHLEASQQQRSELCKQLQGAMITLHTILLSVHQCTQRSRSDESRREIVECHSKITIATTAGANVSRSQLTEAGDLTGKKLGKDNDSEGDFLLGGTSGASSLVRGTSGASTDDLLHEDRTTAYSNGGNIRIKWDE